MRVSKWLALAGICGMAMASDGVLMNSNGVTQNGVAFHVETRLEPATPGLNGGFIGGSVTDNVAIHRYLAYRSLKKFFGYDLKVAPGGENGTFRVNVDPLSISPARVEIEEPGWTVIGLPSYPNPKTVRAGETLAIAMFVNPTPGQTITDYVSFPGDGMGSKGRELRVGLPRKAPEFVFNLPDGRPLMLSSLRGKTVVVSFMFTTCPHCQGLCFILANIQKDYAAKGVQFVGAVIDPGAKDGLVPFTQAYSKGAFPVGWNTQEAAREFLERPQGAFYVPTIVFIDRNGMIVSQYIGNEDFFKEQDKNIRGELDRVVAGRR